MDDHIIPPVKPNKSRGATKQEEGKIKKEIKKHLETEGWFVFHIQQGMGSHAGIADLYAIRSGKGMWIEVKVPAGKQNENQKIFQQNIENHGGFYCLATSVSAVEEYINEMYLHPSTRRQGIH